MCSGVKSGDEANNAIRELASASQTFVFIAALHSSMTTKQERQRKASRGRKRRERKAVRVVEHGSGAF